MILADPEILAEARRLIEEEHYNVVHAVEEGITQIVQIFESMDDAYMRERAFDIKDIKDRILMALLGIKVKDISKLPPDTVLLNLLVMPPRHAFPRRCCSSSRTLWSASPPSSTSTAS